MLRFGRKRRRRPPGGGELGHTKYSLGISDLPVEVLGLILNRLDFESIKIARLVCKTWNREICKSHKDKSITSISSFPRANWYTKFMEKVAYYENRNPPNIEEYAAIYKRIHARDSPTLLHCVALPVQIGEALRRLVKVLSDQPNLGSSIDKLVYHRIYRTLPPEISSKYLPACKTILGQCAVSVTHLDFSNLKSAFFLNVLHGLGRNVKFPGLKLLEIQLEIVNADNLDKYKAMLAAMEQIIRNSPNLCSLSVRIYGSGCYMRQDQGSESIFDFQQIQHLELFYCASEFFLNDISHQRHPPRLKSLVVHDWMNYNREILYRTLRCFSDTLEILSLSKAPMAFEDEIVDNLFMENDFPEMPALKCLAFPKSEYRLSELWMSFKAPSLQELGIGTLRLDMLPTPEEGQVCAEVLKLSCEDISLFPRHCSKSKAEAISALRQQFPNVRKWEINHNDFLLLISSEVNLSLGESQRLLVEEFTCADINFPKVVVKGLKKLIIREGLKLPMSQVKEEFRANLFPDLEQISVERRKLGFRRRKGGSRRCQQM